VISYVMPTRDRADVLAETLDRIGRLPPHDAEVLVIDNASRNPVRLPPGLANGVRVCVVRSEVNLCAGARNLATHHAHDRSRWLVMLDDDSHPLDLGFLRSLDIADEGVGAVAAEIFLPRGAGGAVCRESGGLPEVFIGCGVAIRTGLFRELGGYDHAFDYYAEEYDLSARVMLAGRRIAFDRTFRVEHRKVSAGRDMNRIVGNLVRNNAWVAARYAPDEVRWPEIRQHLTRYARIARKESALRGYIRGVHDLGLSIFDQPRRPMPRAMWDRFTGLAAAREAVRTAMAERSFGSAAIVRPGKNVGQVVQALHEAGVRIEPDPDLAAVRMIGTLSPGPMLDAWAAETVGAPAARTLTPWRVGPAPAGHGSVSAIG
jgi:GT2 family glycosyltransferase